MSAPYPLRALALASILAGLAVPASAYLFWKKPPAESAPVVGNEPGIVIPLAGATPKEMRANLIWTMRGGLNVAALQCQFAPQLRSVELYNNMLRQHGLELADTLATLNGYFKRTAGKTWQTAFDQYTTRTYNSFSTLHAQYTFCETAAAIGRDTLERPSGQLGAIAASRLREFRSSLVPMGDAGVQIARFDPTLPPPPTDLTPVCYDKKRREKPCSK